MIAQNLLFPPTNEVLQRALARYPDRVAFGWNGGQMTYRATADLIGRMQQVYASAGLARGQRVCLLMSNLASGWFAGMAALCSGGAVSWLPRRRICGRCTALDRPASVGICWQRQRKQAAIRPWTSPA